MRNFKRTVCIALSLFTVALCFAGCSSDDNTIDLTNIQLSSDQRSDVESNIYSELEDCDFSGTAYVKLNSQDVFFDSLGYADEDEETEIENDYVYQLSSMTKSFTAAAVMQLESQGKLNTDDTLDIYFDGGSYLKDVTVQSLLDMTSGFGNYVNTIGNSQSAYAKIVKMIAKNPDNEKIKEYITDSIISTGLENDSGTFTFSNSGYYLLGIIIEQASGISYQEYIEESIIEPLDLENTGFISNDTKCSGYSESNDKWRTQDTNSFTSNFYVMFSSMGMTSTAQDLAKFYDAFINNEFSDTNLVNKILNSSTNYGYGFYADGNQIYSEGSSALHTSYVYINTETLEQVILLSNHTGLSDFSDSAKNVYNVLHAKINGLILGNS